jgi:choline dehydrogenase-like flavoprotein
MNSGWSGNMDATTLARDLIKAGYKGTRLIAALRAEIPYHLRLNSSAEILPKRDNRVSLDPLARDVAGIPRPRIRFVMDDYTKRGLDKAVAINQQIFAALGATRVQSGDYYLSNAIIAGTTRMGRDPATSVVDPDLQTHEHANLYIIGPSTHVTAPVNAPSLTVTALAYRLADHLSA